MGNYIWPLIGHQHIKDYFIRAFGAGKIHHAYLFEGPEQVGKMTFARMLGKTLLCEGFATTTPIPSLNKEGIGSVPCGTCRACKAYENHAHPDVLELTRGEEEHIRIDPAREFIRSLSTRPLLGNWRIGIIEEASHLVAAASNALLKTLEEPAKSVVIFLITSKPLLSTIISRCQRIKFGFVPTNEIENSLAGLSDAREITYLAAGRPGRAITLRKPEAYNNYRTAIREAIDLLTKDEGERMLWVSERFGKRGNAGDKREECGEFLSTIQSILRERLHEDFSAAVLLRKTTQAELLLKANVDPRLVCEYLLLDYNQCLFAAKPRDMA